MADEQQVTHLSPSERDDVPEGRYGGPATIDNPPAENSRGFDRKAAKRAAKGMRSEGGVMTQEGVQAEAKAAEEADETKAEPVKATPATRATSAASKK